MTNFKPSDANLSFQCGTTDQTIAFYCFLQAFLMWLIACERELTTSCCACSPFLFVYAFGNVVGLPGDSNKNNKCDFQVASDLKRRRKPKKPKREQLWKTDTEQKIPREIPPTDRPCATDGALQVFLLLAFPVCLALA